MSNEQDKSDAKAHPVDAVVTLTAAEAFEALKNALQQDADYAWSWHCNIAMAHYDAMSEAGCDGHDARHKTANNGAARFMKLCFDIDMTKHRNFTAM